MGGGGRAWVGGEELVRWEKLVSHGGLCEVGEACVTWGA